MDSKKKPGSTLRDRRWTTRFWRACGRRRNSLLADILPSGKLRDSNILRTQHLVFEISVLPSERESHCSSSCRLLATNPGPIIGNITSPLFGHANQSSGGAGNGGFSEAANNRALELQTRFTF